MPLPTRNPGALITVVGGVHACRIVVYVNSIATLQVRTAARRRAAWRAFPRHFPGVKGRVERVFLLIECARCGLAGRLCSGGCGLGGGGRILRGLGGRRRSRVALECALVGQ